LRIICCSAIVMYALIAATSQEALFITMILLLFISTSGLDFIGHQKQPWQQMLDGIIILVIASASIFLLKGIGPILSSSCLVLSTPWLTSHLIPKIPWLIPAGFCIISGGAHGAVGVMDGLVVSLLIGITWWHQRCLINESRPILSRSPISDRESDVARLLVAGNTYKSIADKLYITEGTVKTYVWRMSRKLGTRGRTELIQKLQSFL
ncbi:MAG: helix-turn-helix transcriptional regulator, partial [Firmicutes bacterium]|nr:helix-turn-helix transcriptional regulator [Bacillota bacterium]